MAHDIEAVVEQAENMLGRPEMPVSRHIFVTGANGFIGSALCRFLAAQGAKVTALMRRPPAQALPEGVEAMLLPSYDALEPRHLQGHEAVIHLAGHAHAAHMNPAQRGRAFAEDVRLARLAAGCAATAGAKRFVFVSTIKVLGEQSGALPFDHRSIPAPADAYARARLAGEQAVREVAEAAGMEWIVVRPVLVVGEGARGNLDALLRWISAGRPLPFAGMNNRRSLIGLEDLCELLACCAVHPDAAGRTFIASGDETVSTTDICVALAEGLGVRPRLFRVPRWLWSMARAFPPTRGLEQRLAGSLQADNTETRRLLGWQPRMRARDCLFRLAAWYGKRQ